MPPPCISFTTGELPYKSDMTPPIAYYYLVWEWALYRIWESPNHPWWTQIVRKIMLVLLRIKSHWWLFSRKITNSFYRVRKRDLWLSFPAPLGEWWDLLNKHPSNFFFLLMLPKYQNQINLNYKFGFWYVPLFGPVHTQPILLLQNFHL